MLVRLLYASHFKDADPAAAIQAILAQARRHNQALGITGVLCQGSDYLMQVLEGGREPVNQVYRLIAADPRHTDVTLLHYHEMAERHFAHWTMGHVNLARVNPSLILKYSDRPGFDPFAVGGGAALALLRELTAAAAVD